MDLVNFILEVIVLVQRSLVFPSFMVWFDIFSVWFWCLLCSY